MGSGRRNMEGDFPVNAHRSFRGLRPWNRHGKILIVAGFIYMLVGVSYLISKRSEGRTNSLQVLLNIAPIQFWGSVFIFAGLLAMISSRWPPFAETWGYVVLTSLSVGWGSAYLMGILFAGAPATNINGFFLWGLLGFLWWGISGLLNPEKVVRSDDRPA